VLGSQLPTITDASGLTIHGRKAKITVSGNDAVRVFEVGSGAKLTLARLTVADGKSGDFGGGIYNNSGGTVEVTKSTFSGNSATDLGGGIDNRGTLEVTNSTFSDNKTTRTDGNNFGGGIFNDGTLKVTKSTFSNNSSLQGGGLANFRTLEVTNSTFSANTAAGGGGIYNNDTLKVTNSTFSGNSSTQLSGGAIRNQEQLGPFPGDSGTVTLSNTIVANSPSGGNCGGSIIDGGFNVDDGTTCGFSAANFSKPSTNPRLGLLANNGGPTKTHALLKGSPAIDAIPDGTNGCGTLINTDQRGVERPQGSRCDIGAYEKKVRRR
jgi:predicted outer membrane repeat protein